MIEKVVSQAFSSGACGVASLDPTVEPSATSLVVRPAIDPSTKVFATKGVVIDDDVYRDTTDQTNTGLCFDDYTVEKTITQLVCSVKSYSKYKRTHVVKKRTSDAIVEKETFFSAERKRVTCSSNET